MRIVFLCGSLEPGRDGVGDYTRRLAGELIKQGHQAGVVALNDQQITDEFNGVQESDSITLLVLRLPSHWPSIQRYQEAGLWIDNFNPEWLSLQFVPFSFHPKGLAFGMGRLLNRLGKGRRWHIMVHELWVGMDKEAPMKYVYWGWLQRQLLKFLFMQLKPVVIHTQTKLYMILLEKIGFKPQHLPLFGNISVTPNAGKNYNQRIENNDSSQIISFVVFGGIHPNAPIGQLAEELKIFSNNKGIKVILKMIGRCGSEQLRWEAECKVAGVPVELLGEQSQECVSEVLSSSSFGISTTPASLIEKSGSVAAMREHGLTILCISRAWHPRGIKKFELPPGVIQYSQGGIQEFIFGIQNPYHVNNISAITRQFVNNLLLKV